MKFKFEKIPEQTGFSVFDYENKEDGLGLSTHIAVGNSELEFDIPDSWTKPTYSIASYLYYCLLYTSPSPRDRTRSRMPSSA